ncbi:MAG TPA: glycosyltransferase family 1 protein [Candidatus Dormibacteraeota bacterium]|nr:glycosyltransferase family 1 protein [Candidatus Dormibacteraeota bacterium]
MIVAIDGTPALRPYLTGTEVYARNIIDELATQRSDHTIRVYANAVARPHWLPPGVDWRGIPFPRLWTHWRLRQALRRDRPDVTFIPSHVLPVALGLPSVVTIHDVGHRHEPRTYTRRARWYLELTTRYAARRASRLIAVSQSTADDLKGFYGVPGGRITVVHSGVDPRFRPQSPEIVGEVTRRLQLDQPYFVYVGRNHPRKNLPMLQRAFRAARRAGLDAMLVLAGPGHDPASAGDGIVIVHYVPPDDLPALYAGAIAMVLPSRFEGFGFPALEAMRCGTAVIAANAGALPEIVGTAGVLLSPEDSGEWSQALLELANDPELQRRLIAAGIARSAGFTWEAAAQKTWRVLDGVGERGQAHANDP